jgi:hypothetical protein
MTRKSGWFFLVALVLVGSGILAAGADHIEKTAITGGLRLELHVLPAEPFHTAAQVKADPGLGGMLAVGGAKPLGLAAKPRPDHHLIVHVFDAETGKALSDAKVTMEYRALDVAGRPQGHWKKVPVVVMQVIGKGPETTHYGNNVVLPDGRWAVTVTANGKKAEFDISVSAKGEKIAPGK